MGGVDWGPRFSEPLKPFRGARFLAVRAAVLAGRLRPVTIVAE